MSVSARRLTDPIYLAPATVIIGPPAETQAWLKRHFHDEDPVDPDVAASTLQYDTPDGTTWVTVFTPVRSRSLTLDQLGTVAHEGFHLAARILRNRGVPLTEESEEAYAYYLGSLFVQLAHARSEDSRRRQQTTTTKGHRRKRR